MTFLVRKKRRTDITFNGCLVIITLLLIFTIDSSAQVNDYTPPGEWKEFTIRSIDGGQYLLIDGVDVSDDTLTYLLVDEEMLLLEHDSSLTQINYIEKTGDTLYFFFTHATGLKDIVYVHDGQITVVPGNQEWAEGILTPVEMSDGTLFADLTYVASGFKHPVVISTSGVQILDGNPYRFIAHERHNNEDRVYSYYEDLAGNYFLGYYDIHKGFYLTDIESRGFNLISDNPSDTTHAIITNHSDSLFESKLFKVVDTSFVEISIPGGPYDQIDLLYRNDDTNTSLFQLTDYDENKKLAKRVNGIWTELTESLPPFIGISKKNQSGNEAFFDVTITTKDRQFWYYQSTALGDTLANITPPGGPFDHIHYLRYSFDFPLSFEFEDSIDNEYMYAFWNAQGNLIPPTPVLMNPNGDPAKRVDLKENGVHIFEYDTHDHVYHQAVQGGPLTLLNNHMNADGQTVCSSDNFVLVDLSLHDGTEEFLYYNLDTVVQFDLPARDSVGLHRLKSFGELGCAIETIKSNTQSDSNIYTYTLIDDQLINITHPRWRNFDIQNSNAYDDKEFIGDINHVDGTGKVRLWAITSEPRRNNSCRPDYKFIQEESYEPVSVRPGENHSYLAKKLYLGTRLPKLPVGPGGRVPSYEFRFNQSIEMMPGTTVDSEFDFTVSSMNCDVN